MRFGVLLFTLPLFLGWAAPAKAYFQMEMMKAKVQQKSDTRWTLADWLSQKNKIRIWDHWLAMNKSVPFFDLSLSGAKAPHDFKSEVDGVLTKSDESSSLYEVDLSIYFINLNAEYEDMSFDREARSGSAGIRWFGASSQATSLFTRYGVRELKFDLTDEKFENSFVEGQLQLYVTKFFGIKGRYRKLFAASSKEGRELEGTRSSAGGFIELLIFRIYGEYFNETLELSQGGTITKETREGPELGVKLFF